MRVRVIHCILFTFICISFCYSQVRLPDSVQNEIDSRNELRSKFAYLDSLSNVFLRNNFELYLLLVQKGLEMAEEYDNDSIYNRFRIKEGISKFYRDEFDSARIIYQEVFDNSEGDPFLQAIALSEIGITYYHEYNNPKTLEYFIASLELLETVQDTARIGGITNNIGAIYNQLEDFKNARKYLKKAIKYKLFVSDSVRLGSSFHNLGLTFNEDSEVDSSLYYLNISKRLKLQNNDLRGLATTLATLSDYYRRAGDIEQAEQSIREAIKLDDQLDDQVALMVDQSSLAIMLLEKRDYDEVVSIAKEVIQNSSDAKTVKKMLEISGAAHQKLGNWQQASLILDRLVQLSDSLNRAEKEASLNELRVQFNTEQKEAEIEQLLIQNKLQQLQAEQATQRQLILILIAVALVVIAVLFYSRFKTKLRSNALLDAKNQELVQLNQTKDKLFSIISHDLKSPLSSFHTITKSLTDNWDDLDKEKLKDFIESLRDSSANVRDMMDNLLNWALTQTNQLNQKSEFVNLESIVSRVRDQLKDVSKLKKIDMQTMINSEDQIIGDSQFLEIIIRNLISNALKFSAMESEIKITSVNSGDSQIVSIIDSGVGMKQEQIDQLLGGKIVAHDINNSTEKGTGLGLTLCKELMDKMGAKMEVNSQKGKGTTFKLIFDRAA
jgi:signal transduction histidine kinase